MLTIDIPGSGEMTIAHVLMDFNGTLARDGIVLPGVIDAVNRLSDRLQFHVITADTFGSVRDQMTGNPDVPHRHRGDDTRARHAVPLQIHVISESHQDRQKLAYLETLGADRTIAAGNGMNDRLMLESARLGVATLQDEGVAQKALLAADILVKDILDFFDLLEKPDRLRATLRT